MLIKRIYLFFILLLFITLNSAGQDIRAGERVCGKWESTERNLIIQIFMQDNQFKAKVIWFSDTDGKPMSYWTDVHNPDPTLRHRKILGMSILRDLQYQPATNSWENGMVYDSRHGREWNASAYIGKKGELHVRGYWHFKFIGRTMLFFRVS